MLGTPILAFVIIVAVVLVICWTINFLRKRFVKRRLLIAVSRNITTSHLLPLISNKNVDKKIDTTGRSRCRWLSNKLPFMAIAAVEGNVSTLKLLHENGADITFTDCRTGQNLLHLTCSTGVTEAVRWCLKYPEIRLDCLGSPRPGDPYMTPLMLVLKDLKISNSKVDICKELIKAGCDVSKTDSCNWTMLHYVTIYDNPELVTMVIKASPIHPILNYRNEADGRPCGLPHHEVSPFVSLLRGHSDIVNCLYLLEAGYNLQKDKRFTDDILPSLDPDSELYQYLSSTMQKPPNLLLLCRFVIRGAIGGVHLQDKLQCLNLPLVLSAFLKLDSEFNNTNLTIDLSIKQS